ncbi:MAG TPA: cation-translocating P-type ATPase, partial [Pyrinomonadaceae bacterium]|nr:cation-translocating P-type ATPase [Pyrinomonadaceae bacterium]
VMSAAKVQSKATEAYQQRPDEVLAALDTDPRSGLSQAEVQARREKFGPNELTAEKPVPAWKKFLKQFQDPLVILLLIATSISAGLWLFERESALPYEAMAIFAIVLLNAIMGHIQGSRAEQALAALQQLSAAHANVIRDGVRQNIAAAELVPGDIILIEEGDTIPADARVLQSTALQTAEAALTGESLPVAKDAEPITGDVGLGDRHNMIFSGTAATYGRGKAVVTATGMQTQTGLIAGLLKESPEEITPLQKELARTGKLLGIIVTVIAVVMIATILLVEDVRGFSGIFDVLILGVALAVAAVPEGLPAVVTAVLSLGVQRMARRNAIVRHLAAVETLGSANVIASDKTGTLTKNEMTVRVVVTASGRVSLSGTGYDPEGEVRKEGGGEIDGPLRLEMVRALSAADRANNAVLQERGERWTVQGDPTEGALIVAARKAGLEDECQDARFARIAEVPFSSDRKLMSTVHTDSERHERLLAFTKGAPDVLLNRCSHELVGSESRPLTPDRRTEILKIEDELAGEALRTLGVAFRSLPKDAFKSEEIDERIEKELVLLGLIGMIDPPREEARTAVLRAKAAGIRSIMITGDHPKTAAVIAEELGIAENGKAVTGTELETMTDETLELTVQEVSVYARVNPGHKLRIVNALQRNGAIVAMTGDGVNDAPALKTADIGIAMGITGTDVSREAADIVLADDNFATIVAAVEEGRAIFSNIRKFLRYLLSSNIGEVMTMFFGVLLADAIGLTAQGSGGVVLPLLATQILWINLVTDGAPALALGVDTAEAGLMQKPPRPRTEGVVTRRMWAGIILVGAVTAAGTLLVLDASLPGGLIEGSGNMRYAQTMAFTTLVFFSLFNVLNARSDERSAFAGLFSNKWLWGAVLLSLLLQVTVV